MSAVCGVMGVCEWPVLSKLRDACGRYNRDIFGLRNSTQRACQTPWKFHARSMEIPWNLQSNGYSSSRPGGQSVTKLGGPRSLPPVSKTTLQGIEQI